jgi:hypothetical protein
MMMNTLFFVCVVTRGYTMLGWRYLIVRKMLVTACMFLQRGPASLLIVPWQETLATVGTA